LPHAQTHLSSDTGGDGVPAGSQEEAATSHGVEEGAAEERLLCAAGP